MEPEAKPVIDFLARIGNDLKYQTHFLKFFGRLHKDAYEEYKKSTQTDDNNGTI